MAIDKKILSWLTTVPASDSNFRWNLNIANIETIKEALKNKKISKTARRFLGAQLRRITRRIKT